MKHTVCWITGIAAVLLLIACVVLITMGAMGKPGQPAVLGLIIIGMTCGVIASALGAISIMTYQTPFERKHWAGMDALSKNALPDANIVAAHSRSESLK